MNLTHLGGGPGFLDAWARSAIVFPSSSLISWAWCISLPWFTRRMVVTPATIVSGASKGKSLAFPGRVTGAALAASAGVEAGVSTVGRSDLQPAIVPATTNAAPIRERWDMTPPVRYDGMRARQVTVSLKFRKSPRLRLLGQSVAVFSRRPLPAGFHGQSSTHFHGAHRPYSGAYIGCANARSGG